MGVGVVKTVVLALLVIPLLLLVAACGTPLVPVPPPELDGVIEALGYGLAATSLPEGFEFSGYDVTQPSTLLPDGQVVMPFGGPGEPYASVLYKRFQDYAYHHVFIMYPWSFPSSVSDDFLLESLGIEWRRPDNAVSEVKVNGKTAYLVRGSWSTESLQKLVDPDPEILATYTPSWDYDMYLSLFFDFELSPNETIGVMIRAMLYPADWITKREMVKIAESFQRLD